ncbi:MAG: serine/threonine-protein kinase [Bryobacteraceae bacterium]
MGRYEILEQLGAGSMATVFRARDTVLDREVALKAIRTEPGVDPELRQQYFRESRACARLQHRAIVVVFDIGEADQTAYVATELLTGFDLRKFIDQRQEMPIAAKLAAMADVCDALGYAHRKGVLHRNVKPGNLFLMEDHGIKVLDFGVTRLFGPGPGVAGQLIGTPNYMAPEEILGKPVDSRADLFSAAVVCFEFLVHAHPFHCAFIPRRIVDGPPDSLFDYNPKLPASLGNIFAHALAKDPAERYATGEELAGALRAVIETLRQSPSQPSSSAQPPTSGGTRAVNPRPPITQAVSATLFSQPAPAGDSDGRQSSPTMRLTPEFEVGADENDRKSASSLVDHPEPVHSADNRPVEAVQPDPTGLAGMEHAAWQTPAQSAAVEPAQPLDASLQPELGPARANGSGLAPPTAPGNCPNCDAVNRSESFFCVECGERLKEGGAPPVLPLNPSVDDVAPARAGIDAAAIAAMRRPPEPLPPAAPPKSKPGSRRASNRRAVSAQPTALSGSAVAVAEEEPPAEAAQPEPVATAVPLVPAFHGPLFGVPSGASAPAPVTPVFERILSRLRSGASKLVEHTPASDRPLFGAIMQTSAPATVEPVPADPPMFGTLTASTPAPGRPVFVDRPMFRTLTISAPVQDRSVFARIVSWIRGGSGQPAANQPVGDRPLFGSQANAAPAGSPIRGRILLALGGLAAITAMIVLLFAYPGHNPPSHAGLALRVEHRGADLVLAWNKDSAAIAAASHGVLTISDGDRHEHRDLDASLLASGSFVYTPVSNDVSFEMGLAGDKLTESVRSLNIWSPVPEPETPAVSTPPANKNTATALPRHSLARVKPVTAGRRPRPQD